MGKAKKVRKDALYDFQVIKHDDVPSVFREFMRGDWSKRAIVGALHE